MFQGKRLVLEGIIMHKLYLLVLLLLILNGGCTMSIRRKDRL